MAIPKLDIDLEHSLGTIITRREDADDDTMQNAERPYRILLFRLLHNQATDDIPETKKLGPGVVNLVRKSKVGNDTFIRKIGSLLLLFWSERMHLYREFVPKTRPKGP